MGETARAAEDRARDRRDGAEGVAHLAGDGVRHDAAVAEADREHARLIDAVVGVHPRQRRAQERDVLTVGVWPAGVGRISGGAETLGRDEDRVGHERLEAVVVARDLRRGAGAAVPGEHQLVRLAGVVVRRQGHDVRAARARDVDHEGRLRGRGGRRAAARAGHRRAACADVAGGTGGAALLPPRPAFPVVPPRPALPVVPPRPALPVVPPRPAFPVVPPRPAAPVVPAVPTVPAAPDVPAPPDVPASPDAPAWPEVPAVPAVPVVPALPVPPELLPLDPHPPPTASSKPRTLAVEPLNVDFVMPILR